MLVFSVNFGTPKLTIPRKLIDIDEELPVSKNKENGFKVTYNSLRDALDNTLEHANMQSHYGLIKITVK